MVNKVIVAMVVKFLRNRLWNEAKKLLKQEYKSNKDHLGNYKPPNSTADDISYLCKLIDYCQVPSNDEKQVLTEIYRCLRNCVACSSTNQYVAINDQSFIESTQKICNQIVDFSVEVNLNLYNMILQFLMNSTVNNTSCALKVWNLFRTNLFKLLMNNILIIPTSAIIYSCMKQIGEKYSQEFIDLILDLIFNKGNYSDYLLLLLEHFFTTQNLEEFYFKFNDQFQRFVLEELGKYCKNSLVSIENLKFFINLFNSKANGLLLKSNFQQSFGTDPNIFVLLVQLLASLSSNEEFCFKIMQKNASFIINCVYILIAIHKAGKDSTKNCFTPINALKNLDENCHDNPVFGLKADLIRLIGNMAWKCIENQNNIRDMNCIPVLLDCCNIDAKNPFIIQVVIFAIRNLCEGNIKNQKLISSLNRQGVISSDSLKEFGIALHDDGGKGINIAQLPSKF